MEDLHTRAFVLRTRAYAESDVIATLLTSDHGKLTAIARGARRSKKRFAGPALEPFQELAVRFARRPHSDLGFLHECRVARSHHGIVSDLRAYAWGSYLAELTEAAAPAHDPCPDLYQLFRDAVAELASGRSVDRRAHAYVIGLLDWAGWGPSFDVCCRCRQPLDATVRPIVDPRGSGLACARHEAEESGYDSQDPGYRPSRRVVEPALLDYLRALRSEAVDVADHPTVAIAETTGAATALLHRLVDLHIQRPLRSREFLATVS